MVQKEAEEKGVFAWDGNILILGKGQRWAMSPVFSYLVVPRIPEHTTRGKIQWRPAAVIDRGIDDHGQTRLRSPGGIRWLRGCMEHSKRGRFGVDG